MEGKIIPLEQTMEYASLVEHLETEYPALMRRLLKNGTLKSYLDKQMATVMKLEGRIVRDNPEMPMWDAMEIALAQVLELNPRAEEATPLNKQEREMLKAFKKKYGVRTM